ncbi:MULTISPECIES: UbiA-like polyprenyltransferase [Clostridium]|jgi:4-hydroxybenzoate polyprenyltransferase|uniref:4-hydroxybenzoate polyprenyltransferase n=2 Tax=Clostridium intestinale TaxID=36845 RepID=U2PQA2_9CLOT|nr:MULTISPECIES: UbiA-like polyprenyltransferase [Clostridium]ERK28595.1 4-hydroxybenzoate polyprenyltransferase [Clostridium intestinale URNW]SHI26396.1 4-hydroxybenzoate polyprenyltransferase [Clostridium intestinale DSM 6191]
MVLNKAIKKAHDYGVLVMFSHTIFSLSFALISMLLASKGLPSPYVIFWILVAFMGARTGANAINRVIDAEIDKKNPRTATRQLPQGLMKKKEVILFSSLCFLVMIIGAYMLNPLCLILSPIALFLLIIYSYTKRFTWACHLVLGITSAAAPVGAWLAVTGKISWLPLFIGAANTLWVAGFDIIYGSQDYDFDTANGINSIPARFGVKNALHIAAFFHAITLVILIIVGLLSPQLGLIYFIGIGIISVLFILEHRMVSPTNLSNVKLASYSINQLISIVFLIFGVIDALI